MISPPSLTGMTITMGVSYGVAITFTSFRLWCRYRMRNWWWDDGWAALALLLNAVYLGFVWVVSTAAKNPNPTYSHKSYEINILSYWMATLLFTSTLWSARMCILASVIRIIPPMLPLRRVSFGLAVSFVLMWLGRIIQKIYVCTSNTAWHHIRYIQCHFGDAVGWTELATDVFADSVLIAIPLRTLWHIRLPRNQRVLILILFGSSVWTTVASMVHALFLFSFTGPLTSFAVQGITAHLEVAVSLIVCNLLVVTTYVYRVCFGGEDLESVDSSVGDPTNIVTIPTSQMPTGQYQYQTDTVAELTQLSSVYIPESYQRASVQEVWPSLTQDKHPSEHQAEK